MVRVHRSIARRARKIDATDLADRAEDYLFACQDFRKYIEGVPGLVGTKMIRSRIRRIDGYEREVAKLERKIDRLLERRSIEAVRLEEDLRSNMVVLRDYLEPEVYRGFDV